MDELRLSVSESVSSHLENVDRCSFSFNPRERILDWRFDVIVEAALLEKYTCVLGDDTKPEDGALRAGSLILGAMLAICRRELRKLIIYMIYIVSTAGNIVDNSWRKTCSGFCSYTIRIADGGAAKT